MTKVVVFSESESITEELATAARSLVGDEKGGWASVSLAERGRPQPGGPARRNMILARTSYPTEGNSYQISYALGEVLNKDVPQALLIGSSRLGREIAGTLSVALGWPVLCDVRQLRFDGDTLMGQKAVYAGRFTAGVRSRLPCIATIPPGAYQQEQKSEDTGSEDTSTTVLDLEVGPTDPKVRTVETRPKPKTSVDLKSAKRIVSAGRGIKRKEDLEIIKKLADAMDASLGASRPLSSDLGWLGEEHHIGLTGVYVHPELYVAVGISGQLQHVAGIRDSKVIVAINKDKQAPIFQVADYGVVGDLYEVVPALLKALGVG